MHAVPWLILPTYDEAANLERVAGRALHVLRDALGPEGFRVLVVDDASPDGTGEIADAMAAAHGEVEVLHRTGPRGLGYAYLAGFDRALAGGATHVWEMDADGSHDPGDLPRLLSVVRDGEADVALGSRYVPGGGVTDWGALRRFVSRAGSRYARTVLGVPVRDLTGGFKCFRRDVLEAIDLPTVRSHGYAFQVELTLRSLVAGFRVSEVPIVFRDRLHGRSKMSARIAAEAVLLVPRLRRQAGHVAPPAEAGGPLTDAVDRTGGSVPARGSGTPSGTCAADPGRSAS